MGLEVVNCTSILPFLNTRTKGALTFQLVDCGVLPWILLTCAAGLDVVDSGETALFDWSNLDSRALVLTLTLYGRRLSALTRLKI
jgi:hypothetical protein